MIEKIIKKLIPPSQLDCILEEGFVPTTEDFGPHGYDLELYAKKNERIIYDGKNDKILSRYVNDKKR